jgi:hypothetical protein
VPGRLHVAFDPFLDVFDVLLGVLEISVEVALVAVHKAGSRRLRGVKRERPGTMLNASREVAGQCIRFGGGKVHILGTSFRVEFVERVLDWSAYNSEKLRFGDDWF